MKHIYVTAIFIITILCDAANAQSSCHSFYVSNLQLPAVEECTARINAIMVVAVPHDSAKITLWCWAASLSMIYTAEGHPISQEQIISQNFSNKEDMPTSDFLRFADRINRDYIDANGKKFTSSTMQVFSTEDIARSLSEGFPVLFYNFNHHSIVQTSMTYYHSFSGGFRMKDGIFWDPLPGFGYSSGSGSSSLYSNFSDDGNLNNNSSAAWSVTTR
jgi:Peptidase_C39 like family